MYNVNVNGGSEKTTYYGSVGFNDVGGLLKEQMTVTKSLIQT